MQARGLRHIPQRLSEANDFFASAFGMPHDTVDEVRVAADDVATPAPPVAGDTGGYMIPGRYEVPPQHTIAGEQQQIGAWPPYGWGEPSRVIRPPQLPATMAEAIGLQTEAPPRLGTPVSPENQRLLHTMIENGVISASQAMSMIGQPGTRERALHDEIMKRLATQD
jgi:hypothetical protein